MKNIFKITLASLLLATLWSCDLNRYPDTAVPEKEAMSTPAEAQQVIFGIYSAFKNSSLHTGTLTTAQDIQSDMLYAIQGYGNSMGDIYRWSTKSTDSYVQGVYAGLYLVISRCNFYFDNIEALNAKFTTTADKDNLRKCTADAHFMRAFAYSELIRIYCKAYDSATAQTDLGVVLRTSYADTQKRIRSTMADSYALVLSDIAMAEKLNKRDGNSSPYATKGAVRSLAARVHLYMKNWRKAADYATEVIENPNYKLADVNTYTYSNTYNDYKFMWVYDQGPEVIWHITMSNTDLGGALGQPFLGSKVAMGAYLPDFIPAQWLLDLYDQYDARYMTFFSEVKTGYDHGLTWPLVNKYPGNPDIDAGGQPLLTNKPKIFRLSELHLIRAEAYYRLNRADSANMDLTKLRRARIIGYGTSSSTGDQLFKEIQNERAKELCMEGFRLNDLKRWGLGFQRKPQSYTVDGPNSLRVQSNNPLFTWPIPKHEMDAVQGMQPNESND